MTNNNRKKSNNNIIISSSSIVTVGFIALILLGLQQAYGQSGKVGIEALPSTPAQIAPDGTFQSTVDGFRLKVPTGWGVKDIDNLNPTLNMAGKMIGFDGLATVCNEHTTGLGGTTECNVTPDSKEVNILRLPDLNQRPDVQSLILSQNKTITIQDLLILFEENVMDRTGEYDDKEKAATMTPRQINVTNAEGTTLSSVEGLLTESEIDVGLAEPIKSYALIVLSPDKNTGYMAIKQAQLTEQTPTMPPEVQQIFDSFELIVT